VKQRLFEGGIQGVGKVKGEGMGGEYGQSTFICMHEKRIMKSIKIIFKREEKG
jgi:hypothetical protein